MENKNHWRRDPSRWLEDRTATRNPQAGKNLAQLRGALLALIPIEEYGTFNGAMDHYANYPWQAISLINKYIIITP